MLDLPFNKIQSMKNLLILFLTIFSNQLFSQKTTIAGKWEQNNIVYTLIDNPISITVKDHNCRKIIIKANVGTLKGSNCNYIYTMTDSAYSRDKLSIGVKNWFKVNWIDSVYLEVRKIPDPFVLFALTSNGDSISKVNLQSYYCIFFVQNRFVGDFELVRSSEEKVIAFTLKIVRGDSILLTEKNLCQNTPCYTDSLYTKNAYGQLEFYDTRERDISTKALNFIINESIPGDKLIFEDIIVNMFGKENRKMGDITITIGN